MESESKPPLALASGAAGQAEAEALRAETGVSIVGTGSLSATPVEKAVVLSADLVRWSVQVEGEVRRVALKAALSVSLFSLQDDAATCSSQ